MWVSTPLGAVCSFVVVCRLCPIVLASLELRSPAGPRVTSLTSATGAVCVGRRRWRLGGGASWKQGRLRVAEVDGGTEDNTSHSGVVRTVALEGELLLTGGEDAAVKVWVARSAVANTAARSRATRTASEGADGRERWTYISLTFAAFFQKPNSERHQHTTLSTPPQSTPRPLPACLHCTFRRRTPDQCVPFTASTAPHSNSTRDPSMTHRSRGDANAT